MPEENLDPVFDEIERFERRDDDAAFRRAYELFCPGKADDFDHRHGCPNREFIPTRDARRGLVLAFSKGDRS